WGPASPGPAPSPPTPLRRSVRRDHPARRLDPPRVPGAVRVEDRAAAVPDPERVDIRAAPHVQLVRGVAPPEPDPLPAPRRQVRLQPVPDPPRPAGYPALRMRLRSRPVVAGPRTRVTGPRPHRGE